MTVDEILESLPVRVLLPYGKTVKEAAEEVLRADTRFSVRSKGVERGFDFAQPNLEVRTTARNIKEKRNDK